MKFNNADTIIIGGGLIGLTIAFFLGKIGLKVIIIDKNKITSKQSIDFDFRTTAISEGSKKILDSNNIWRYLQKNSQKIEKIKVFDRYATNNLDFINPKQSKVLGYIVENKYIKKALISEIKKYKNIKIIEDSVIQDLTTSDNEVTLKTDESHFKSKLLIASDGKNSFIRKLENQSLFKKKYDQSALVLNIVHEKNHMNTAYEIFYKSGPLAILPMKNHSNRKFKSSIVWSHSVDFINSLNSCDDSFLCKIIDEKTYNYIGQVEKIIKKKVFNLSAHLNTSIAKNRVIYVGDSAHSIHPIAGQGWNLGIRDSDCLQKILIETLGLGIDIGSKFVMKKYNDERHFDMLSLYQITDKFNFIFSKDDLITKGLRGIGFEIINANPTLKKFITSYAMGER